MASAPTLPSDLLLCVFVHGFKGDESTFLDFPSRLAHNLQETIQNVKVESLVFPAYETKGELRDAVERFVEWLQHQVLQREVSHAIELGGESGAAGAAKVVLCGHSMGGLVISDALSSVQLAHNNDGPLWPRIIAVLAFDTPYLGLHPNMFKGQAEQGIGYVNTAHGVVSSLSPLLGGTGILGTSSTGNEVIKREDKDKPARVVSSSEGPSWGKWAAIGGSVLAAGAAATAWYHRDKVTSGWSFVTDHFKYVGNLWNEDAMKGRLQRTLQASQRHQILFRTFYTYLPKKANQPRPRTFIILPSRNDPAAPYFIAARNEKAENEIDAHIGMFAPKTNDGYYELGLKTAHLVKEATHVFLSEKEKTLEVDGGEIFDQDGELEKNRKQVAQDGRDAEATGKPEKPEGMDIERFI